MDTIRSLNELFDKIWNLVDQLLVVAGQVNGLVEVLKWLANISLDFFLHWLYSGSLGLLVYYVTWSATLWLLGSRMFRSHSKISWQAVLEPGIWRFSLFCALYASWLAHLWWDGLLF